VFQILCGFSVKSDMRYECVKVSPLRMAGLQIRHILKMICVQILLLFSLLKIRVFYIDSLFQ